LTFNQLATSSLFNEIAFTNSQTVVQPPASLAARYDFDGDGSSDPVIFRPTTGTWWYAASGSNNQFRAVQWGANGDKVVAADYDGDGHSDFAVYRSGTWYIMGSTSGTRIQNFGLAGDIPQPGDYDGDGRADLAVYRPSDSTWYMLGSQNGFSAVRFGISTDIPEAADFDGDGRMDQAVYRSGAWYILGSTSGFSPSRSEFRPTFQCRPTITATERLKLLCIEMASGGSWAWAVQLGVPPVTSRFQRTTMVTAEQMPLSSVRHRTRGGYLSLASRQRVADTLHLNLVQAATR